MVTEQNRTGWEISGLVVRGGNRIELETQIPFLIQDEVRWALWWRKSLASVSERAQPTKDFPKVVSRHRAEQQLRDYLAANGYTKTDSSLSETDELIGTEYIGALKETPSDRLDTSIQYGVTDVPQFALRQVLDIPRVTKKQFELYIDRVIQMALDSEVYNESEFLFDCDQPVPVLYCLPKHAILAEMGCSYVKVQVVSSSVLSLLLCIAHNEVDASTRAAAILLQDETERAVAESELRRLTEGGKDPGPDDPIYSMILSLAVGIVAYDRIHYPIAPPSPEAVALFRSEQSGEDVDWDTLKPSKLMIPEV